MILVMAINATGLFRGAAITTALAALGPFGMMGGIATLGVIALISEGITKYGVDAIYSSVVKELYRRGESKDSIKDKINKYPVSKSLKRKLTDSLDKISLEG